MYWEGRVGFGFCGDSRLEVRDDFDVLKRGIYLFGRFFGCERKRKRKC